MTPFTVMLMVLFLVFTLSQARFLTVEPELRRSVRQVQARWAEFPGGSAESKEPVHFMKTHHRVHVHYLGDDQHHHHHHHHGHHGGEDKRGKEASLLATFEDINT
ncbi:hypothetical protein ERO13_A11G024500v2 [Gossypium hirsutum]|nr:hypothetical protein ERO13_A11G024500v2 [Gossypium hirsutum]TYG92388.1 hypothetical protein ES288_A11G026500v1 [Gossypium darwinii]